jgi:hypothetical protein
LLLLLLLLLLLGVCESERCIVILKLPSQKFYKFHFSFHLGSTAAAKIITNVWP